MIMFKIGTVDYSNRVIAERYRIAKEPQYESWKDASGTEHRSTTRTQVKGSFSMYFKTLEEYLAFTENMADLREDDLSVYCTVCDNKTNTEQSIYAFIDFTPDRAKNALNEDTMGVINISITER